MCRQLQLLTLLTSWFAGCMPDLVLDPEEREMPIVQFDPDKQLIPMPNDLLLTAGLVALPPWCTESALLRELRIEELNTLDGFGINAPQLQLVVTDEVDETSLAGRGFLFPREVEGVVVIPAEATPILLDVSIGTTLRFDEDCAGFQTVHTVTLQPRAPLRERATYAAAVLRGMTTAEGRLFGPSPMWNLVRQERCPVESVTEADGSVRFTRNQTGLDPNNPTDRARLHALEELWAAHKPALGLLTRAVARQLGDPGGGPLSRSEILAAWEFTTQSVTRPFDRTVLGSPASALARTPDSLFGAPVVISGASAIRNAIGEGFGLDPTQVHPCDRVGVPCGDIGLIVRGQYLTLNFQRAVRNPGGLDEPVPGKWNHPLDATPDPERPEAVVDFLAVVPNSNTHPLPPGGYPTVLVGQGLFGIKEVVYWVGPVLAQAGILSIAIDWVGQGERAVQISDSAADGCDKLERYWDGIHCYEHIVSPDPVTARDNIRQSTLDALKLLRVLSACGTNACGPLAVDPSRIGYLGQSMGAMIGTLVAAMSPEVKAAVLNVGGAGWVRIFTESEAPSIRCPVVDGLIEAGILAGERWGDSNPGALCFQSGWQEEPAFVVFRNLAQWVLDAADPGSFAQRLQRRVAAGDVSVMVQQVMGDEVVPNATTETLARALGLGLDRDGDAMLDPVTAAVATTNAPSPTSEAASGASTWIAYRPVDSDDQFAGNAFSHVSIYGVSCENRECWLGTWQMQADAVAFLLASGME